MSTPCAASPMAPLRNGTGGMGVVLCIQRADTISATKVEAALRSRWASRAGRRQPECSAWVSTPKRRLGVHRHPQTPTRRSLPRPTAGAVSVFKEGVAANHRPISYVVQHRRTQQIATIPLLPDRRGLSALTSGAR